MTQHKTVDIIAIKSLTLSLPNKLSAKLLVCFKSASMSLKVGENVIRESNSLDPGETPSYSASHPDPSCLHMALKSCLAVLGLNSKITNLGIYWSSLVLLSKTYESLYY